MSFLYQFISFVSHVDSVITPNIVKLDNMKFHICCSTFHKCSWQLMQTNIFQINATTGKNIFIHLLQLLPSGSSRATLLHAKYVYTILNDLDHLSRKKLFLLLKNYIYFLAKILWTFLRKFAFYSLWRLHCQHLVTPLWKFKLI